MRERAEAERRATALVPSDARVDADVRQALPLVIGALDAGRAVVVRVDAEAAALDGPDRKLVGRPGRPRLGRQRATFDKPARLRVRSRRR